MICFCPYCGHRDSAVCFWTQEQVRRCLSELAKDAPGKADVPHLAGKEFGVEIDCDKCALRFVAYGVFKACPHCGQRTSLQFLKSNLAIIRKEISLAQTLEPVDAARIIAKASEDTTAVERAFWSARRPSGFDPRRYPALAKRQKEDNQKEEPSVYVERRKKLERARHNAGLPSVFDFPTPELAYEWSLVCQEKGLLAHLSLIEHNAEYWVETYEQYLDPAP